MAYGLEVKNAGNRVIISSDFSYSNMFVSGSGSYTPGSAFPSFSSSELVFAKPFSTGYAGRYLNTWGPGTAGVVSGSWLKLSLYETLSPPSGYGLNVFDSLENLVFSATAANSILDIVFIGTISSGTSITQDVSAYNMDELYVCMLNTITFTYIGGGIGLNSITHIDYYVDRTAKTITANSYFSLNGGAPSALPGFTYVIARYRG